MAHGKAGELKMEIRIQNPVIENNIRRVR